MEYRKEFIKNNCDGCKYFKFGVSKTQKGCTNKEDGGYECYSEWLEQKLTITQQRVKKI